MRGTLLLLPLFVLPLGAGPAPAGPADESVFVKGLLPGQHESLLYVWTSDADAKDPDFLTVVDADPKSARYGTVLATVPTGTTVDNEAHHLGYTVNADRIFAGGLVSNRLFIYDVKTDPRRPKLVKTIPELGALTGYSGPHTYYAVPGGVMIAMLGSKQGGAPGALVTLDNDGNLVSALPAPNRPDYPGYMYDVGVKPELNRMVSSSWTHPHHFRGNPVAPDNVGDAVVVWDWKAGKVLQVEHLDKMPLEVRWQHGPAARGGFINSAGASTIWYWEDKGGKLAFTRVIQLPANSTPADVRISYDNRLLYVSLFAGNAVQQYDVSDPLHPKFVSEVKLSQPNMMRLTPDSRRLYVSNSLLSNLDGKVPFRVWLINVGPGGMALDEKFQVDFDRFATGAARPHDMLLK
ncbi:MAG TPA: selenium-binding protein SBP56-related protein [Gemmatimonadales bacterium]|nr:selenium-binding protein SBP56-related protein [Gemmatimonadales bacterium]